MAASLSAVFAGFFLGNGMVGSAAADRIASALLGLIYLKFSSARTVIITAILVRGRAYWHDPVLYLGMRDDEGDLRSLAWVFVGSLLLTVAHPGPLPEGEEGESPGLSGQSCRG